MKILYLSPTAALAGAERSLLDVVTAVGRQDPAARRFIVAFRDGPALERARREGVAVTLLRLPAILAERGGSQATGWGLLRSAAALAGRGAGGCVALWRFVRQLRRTVAALNPDVIHSNGIESHLLTRLAGLGRWPVLWHLHFFISSQPLWAHPLRWASPRAVAAVGISRGVADDARQLFPALPVRLIYYGIDTDHFAPGPGEGARLDELAGLPPAAAGTVRVGLPARFAHWKGQKVLLEAAGQLVREGLPAPVRFYFIGGPTHAWDTAFTTAGLRAWAGELGIDRHVAFTGFVHDMPAVYRALDIVLNASTEPEAYGRTVVEAMACGKPVVVAEAGGAAELFTHGEDAWGVPPGDARALAVALRRLVASPALRARLGENGRRTVVQRFEQKRQGQEFVDIYGQLVRKWQARAAA